MLDTYRHKGLRSKMIEELRTKNYMDRKADDRVLQAMERVPRHRFIDTIFDAYAYQDRAFPIGDGQTISQPSTVLVQTMLLDLKPGEKILEIGTGSGYQAAVLDKMGVNVFSIERQRELYLKTKKLLSELKCRVRPLFGDGYAGCPQEAPFDKILVTCGAPFLPQALWDQLKPNGLLVVPLGEKEHIMTRFTKLEDGTRKEETFGNYHFVPMLSSKNTPRYPQSE